MVLVSVWLSRLVPQVLYELDSLRGIEATCPPSFLSPLRCHLTVCIQDWVIRNVELHPCFSIHTPAFPPLSVKSRMTLLRVIIPIAVTIWYRNTQEILLGSGLIRSEFLQSSVQILLTHTQVDFWHGGIVGVLGKLLSALPLASVYLGLMLLDAHLVLLATGVNAYIGVVFFCFRKSFRNGLNLPNLSAETLPVHKGVQWLFAPSGGITAESSATAGSVHATGGSFWEGTGSTAPTTWFFHQFLAPNRVCAADELFL